MMALPNLRMCNLCEGLHVFAYLITFKNNSVFTERQHSSYRSLSVCLSI